MPDLRIAIRPAGTVDTAALAGLHARAFDSPWDAEAFRALLGDPSAIALAAPDASVLLGFILLRAAADEADLVTIAVDPARRRAGIGRRLLGAALDAAMDRGVRRIVLEVDAANGAAQALYQGAGFSACGRRVGYYRRPDGTRRDALMLHRLLGEEGRPGLPAVPVRGWTGATRPRPDTGSPSRQ